MSIMLHEHTTCRVATIQRGCRQLNSTQRHLCVSLLVTFVQTMSLFATTDVPTSVIFHVLHFPAIAIIYFISPQGQPTDYFLWSSVIFCSCKFSAPVSDICSSFMLRLRAAPLHSQRALCIAVIYQQQLSMPGGSGSRNKSESRCPGCAQVHTVAWCYTSPDTLRRPAASVT